ncbi:MAG: dicarboxylate/amino acid:cation symporter [Burkholderiales bacterium]|nr:dicarboxylate/amino acid:cation symporter [Burkholderiales bacterium]
MQFPPTDAPPGLWARWLATPLYLRILGALVLGLLTGVVLGEQAGALAMPAKLMLRMLSALAPPLILFAIVRALVMAELPAGTAPRLAKLLLLNTTVAIAIGLLVANLLQPGTWHEVGPTPPAAVARNAPGPLEQFVDNIPRSLLGPLTDNGSVVSVIILAIAFGIALRHLRDRPLRTVRDAIDVGFDALIVILRWVIEIIPFGIFGIIASIVGTKGFAAFIPLGGFVVAVVLALLLQAGWYLVRIRFGSWVRPGQVLRGTRDALVMAFSTASSTATMPVTYACLRDKVGLRERSASLGALVGANFNNDGTALYEAMAALFIAQVLGMELSLTQQLLVVVTSMAASVGAAGIPEAGLVTMTMVFMAVGLPVEYIAVLFSVDWFLDRCRTTINVMGDINVSALLDGRQRRDELLEKAG